jgi:hypothetical protein
MNRIPVFISFDYAHDLATKNRLVTEWGRDDCPIWIKEAFRSLRPSPGQVETVLRGMESVAVEAGTSPDDLKALSTILKL